MRITASSESNIATMPIIDTAVIELKDSEFRYKLSHTLQSSLDLHETLATFYQMLQRVVRCSGIEYCLPNRTARLPLGTQRTHSAKYTLRTGDAGLGEMTFFRSARFKEEDLSTLETLLTLLLMPLRNALLYRDALDNSLRDSLTGIGNRAALELTLQRELKLSHRNGRTLTLLIADVDSFKQINDHLGHTIGDQLLSNIAGIIRSALRETDQVFRYGGEEFVVVLSNTAAAEATIVAERIRQSLAVSEMDVPGGAVRATLSIGASTSSDTDSRDSLFERADKALYQAKNTGRNRVVMAVHQVDKLTLVT